MRISWSRDKNLILIIVLTVIFFILYQTHAFLVANNYIDDSINSSGMWAPVVFIFFFVLISMFLVPKVPFIFLGAAIFGIFWGAIYSIIGATIGAVLEFVLVRYVFEKKYKNKFQEKFKKILSLQEKYKKEELLSVFILYSLPGIPFQGVTIVLSITNVKFINFFIGLLLNTIPSTFIYAYFGHSLFHLKDIHIIISSLLVILLIYTSSKLVSRIIINKK